ncbi:GNAT family N-acetyltransferase [Rhodobacteraceae bacterium NNCM2]|nr:GNAT family N-acetyltransferase [Coraliihabitans acroporae]
MTAEIQSGWYPGLIGWVTAEHGRYYAAEWGFSCAFEAKVAHEMGAFASRLDQPGCHLFSAREEGETLGAITVDGAEVEQGLVHLRWFIVSPRARGKRIGQRLLTHAVAAARGDGAEGLYLWTFKGLDPARRLYLSAGFQLVQELKEQTWGRTMTEQRYDLRFRE